MAAMRNDMPCWWTFSGFPAIRRQRRPRLPYSRNHV